MKLPLHKSNDGTLCLWESGGGRTNTGHAKIIATADGTARRAKFVRTTGNLSCMWHAQIPVSVGDYVILARHSRLVYDVLLLKIAGFEENDLTPDERKMLESFGDPPLPQHRRLCADLDEVARFHENVWDHEPPLFLNEAVEAAYRKAKEWHCDKPVYALPSYTQEDALLRIPSKR